MAQWRDFDASNEEGTCVWCGKKLRYKVLESHYDSEWVPLTEEELKYNREYGYGDHTEKKKHTLVVDKRAEVPGDYQDGFFCGLRCGYSFGVRLAQLGRRLAPKGES